MTDKTDKSLRFDNFVTIVSGTQVVLKMNLMRAHPELWAAMQEAEDSVNELWLKTRTEVVDPETFQDVVIRWKAHHLKAREMFRERSGLG